jgi:hypothetical protein
VRSIRAGVNPCGEASASTVDTTACTIGSGTTAPHSASTAGSVSRSYCGCGSFGCAASCPTSGGASTTSFNFLASTHPVSQTDVSAPIASMVAWVVAVDLGSDPLAPGTASLASPGTTSAGPDPHVAGSELVTS